MRKIRTGILGGSFDPVHKAHVKIAQNAAKKANLDELFFIPAHQAPLRSASYQASDSDRLNMLKLALKRLDFPWAIETYELQNPHTNYSIDTLEYLKNKYPERDFFWIIGSDHIPKLKLWKDIGKLCENTAFICAKRPDYIIEGAEIPHNARIIYMDSEEMPHSSSQIRRDLALGDRNNFMLDSEVLKYILEHKLYNT